MRRAGLKFDRLAGVLVLSKPRGSPAPGPVESELLPSEGAHSACGLGTFARSTERIFRR